MRQYTSIDVDLDVYKRIELDRRSFEETANAVLRRLLGVDVGLTSSFTAGRPWSGKGVELPHGTRLRMEYNGRTHFGLIEDGAWKVEEKIFNSPSAAAGGVALTKSGKHPSLDGWIYWQVLLPSESDWCPLSELRHNANSREH